MNFKDIVARDIHAVFLNPAELAEPRTIRYDGWEYPDIPVSLQGLEAADRQRLSASGFGRGGPDGAPGLHQMSGVMFCAVSDLGGKVPKQGNYIQISHGRQRGPSRGDDMLLFFRTYRIGLVENEMGMLRIELEGTGE